MKLRTSQVVKKLLYFLYFQEKLDILELLLTLLNFITVQLRRHYTPDQ